MGHEPTSQHAMAQTQHQQAQWDREDQWAQLQGAVSPTRGRTQAANTPGAADWGLHSDSGGELLLNHLPQQQATHREGSSPSTGLHRRCCG